VGAAQRVNGGAVLAIFDGGAQNLGSLSALLNSSRWSLAVLMWRGEEEEGNYKGEGFLWKLRLHYF
jgi:hypothetical protein